MSCGKIIFIKMFFVFVLVSNLFASNNNIEFIGSFDVAEPQDVACDGQGNYYVVSANGSAVAISPEGALRFELGRENGTGALKRAAGVASSGAIVYVSDSILDAVLMFSGEGEYLGKFGAPGNGYGEFNDPLGMYFHGDTLYVADSNNGRIQIFGQNGVFIGHIGFKEQGENRLKRPVDLVVDNEGVVYVLDEGDSSVKKYSADGRFLGTVSQVARPTKISYDGRSIYVADEINNLMHIVKRGENETKSFGLSGLVSDKYGGLGGFFVGKDHTLVVSDTKQNKLNFYNLNGEEEGSARDFNYALTTVLLKEEIELDSSYIYWNKIDGLLYSLCSTDSLIEVYDELRLVEQIPLPGEITLVAIAVDSQGEIWGVDGRKSELVRLSRQGEVKVRVGKWGAAEGFFSNPTSLVVSENGIVYVADTGNARVQAFSKDGIFLFSFGDKYGEFQLKDPVDVDLTDDERILVLDSRLKTVCIFSENGEYLNDLNEISGKALDRPSSVGVGQDVVYVADSRAETLKVFTLDGVLLRMFGSYGREKGQFQDLVTLVAPSLDEVLVLDRRGKRLQSFDINQTPGPIVGLQADSGERSVHLRWSESTRGSVVGYRVYRSGPEAVPFELIAETPTPGFVDENLIPGVAYRYAVTAVSERGREGSHQSQVEAVSLKSTARPPVSLVAHPYEWKVELVWKEAQVSNVSLYKVYMNQFGVSKLLGETEDLRFVVEGLDPLTDYDFHVTALSVDGHESGQSTVKVRTAAGTRPPVEIVSIRLDDVFSNSYKSYESNGIGEAVIRNNTSTTLTGAKLSLFIKEYMDFQTEVIVPELHPKSESNVKVLAVFNNKLLEITEDTPVQVAVKINYYENEELKEIEYSETINIYEKHRQSWSDPQRFASFVTPKDEVVLEFVRDIVTHFPKDDAPLLQAGILFDVLSDVGVAYLQDPSNPYQITSGKTDFVDYIQYPRETLQRRSGDCDDLVALFSAMLESLGIRTQAVEIPGHMFMMFESKLDPNMISSEMLGLFVHHDDLLWIPLETTLVGSSFLSAWEVGSSNYHKWKDHGLSFLDIRNAWESYKPASLKMSDWRPSKFTSDKLDVVLPDLERLRSMRLNALASPLLTGLRENPDDDQLLLQLGFLYAEQKDYVEAKKYFEKAVKVAPDVSAIHNNLGNVNFVLENYTQAEISYKKAIDLDPLDPYVWVNLARTYIKKGDNVKASAAFSSAVKLDPMVSKKHRGLALELMNPMKP